MGTLTPRPSGPLLASQVAGKAFGKRRNTALSHKSPFCLGTLLASGTPDNHLWACLTQAGPGRGPPGGSLSEKLAPENKEDPNSEKAKGEPRVAGKHPKRNQSLLKDFPPMSKMSNQEGTGIPGCQKESFTIWGWVLESVCCWLREEVGPGTPGRRGMPRNSPPLGWKWEDGPKRQGHKSRRKGKNLRTGENGPSVQGRGATGQSGEGVSEESGILLNHYIEYVPLWRAAKTQKNNTLSPHPFTS